ncbi:unnamed protein product [Ixodes persulcatus]
MTEAVLKALRESSKGKLHYDPYWLQDGRWPEILGAAETFQFDSRLLPHSFSEDDSVPDLEEPEPTPASVDEPSERDAKPATDDAEDLKQFVDTSGTDLSILEYEEERLNSVREALRKRWAQHEQQLLKWQQQAQKHVLLMERDQLLEYQRQLDRLNRDYAQGLQDLAEKKEKVQEHHKNHARHLRNKIKEAELKQKQLEEEERKRQAESEQRAESLSAHCRDMEATLASVRAALESCSHARHLGTAREDHLGLLDRVARQVAAFGALRTVSREELTQALDLATEVKGLVHAVIADIEQATAKGLETQQLQRQKSEEHNPSRRQSTVASDASSIPAPAPSAHVAARSATSLLQRHSDILDNLDKWQASYKELSQDKTRKKYCFDLLKAVTIPVNALANSLSVRDKLDQLTSILSGKPFQSGSRTISASAHPLAQRFCLDKVAEKIVLQGEEQINSNADSAFPVAALAVGLWCKFPEIGDLLLGHFYLRCPFLVPVFFRKDPSQSETDYLSLCGYKCSQDGCLETETQFLHRITGLVRLYAAMIQTPAPPWHKGKPHPLGPERGWAWLAATTNATPPSPDLAATLLCTFLEVAGWLLGQVYGRQFRKGLHMLCKDYFPRLKQEAGGTSGPVARLEALLQQVLRRGQVARPDASLGQRVWT